MELEGQNCSNKFRYVRNRYNVRNWAVGNSRVLDFLTGNSIEFHRICSIN